MPQTKSQPKAGRAKRHSVGRLVRQSSFCLRHYGADRYDPAKFIPVSDRQFIKPNGGLWTSPVDSAYGWRHWCEAESFGDLTKYFDIGFKGRVLIIDSEADLDKLPWCEPSEHWRFPIFEPLTFMGVDAIHLTERGQEETRWSHPRSLCGWDCETVLVMNADCLLPNTD